jgi:MFS transporter, PAT family, beta-lactamase induction signal transducer AmpG
LILQLNSKLKLLSSSQGFCLRKNHIDYLGIYGVAFYLMNNVKVNNHFSQMRNPRIQTIFLLGISSGLPFILILATLHARLVEAGANNSMIGFFTLITIPYALKFMWAPLVDLVQLPFLTKRFGQRKGWLLFSQLTLIITIFFLGFADPQKSMFLTAICGFLVAISSATQDIVYEAYRIEILKTKELAWGASASMLGYRLGMWISGAGALYLAEFFDWFISFSLMAVCILIGLFTTLKCPEPRLTLVNSKTHLMASSWQNIKHVAVTLLKNEPWLLILAYIFFFKMGDTTLNVMTVPFLLNIGFSKAQIAHVAKSFGIGTMILGSFLGTALLTRYPLILTLMLCSILQIFSCIMFCVQACLGNSLVFLIITITIENLTSGISTAGLIAYFSSMCKTPFTASQYALLSSGASFCRIIVSNLLGPLADRLSWEEFYALMGFLCLPSFILLLIFSRQFNFKTTDENTFIDKQASEIP